MDRDSAIACASLSDALKLRKFGGDFNALLAWWRQHELAEHATSAQLRALVLTQGSEPAAPAVRPAECEAICAPHRPVRLSRAELFKRVFDPGSWQAGCCIKFSTQAAFLAASGFLVSRLSGLSGSSCTASTNSRWRVWPDQRDEPQSRRESGRGWSLCGCGLRPTCLPGLSLVSGLWSRVAQ